MWRNPAYYPEPEKTIPPEDRGERLATLPRERDGTELRVSRQEYEGRPYLSLRVWRRDHDGGWWPTRKGLSIRTSEAQHVAEALAAAVSRVPAQAPRPVAADPPLEPRRDTPPPPAASPLPALENPPPAWLIAAAGAADQAVALEGSPKQIAWAEQIRASWLAPIRRRVPELLPVLLIVRDATWWIANRDAALAEIRWPQPEQTTATVSSAASPLPGRSESD
jgi:hypothetical protein